MRSGNTLRGSRRHSFACERHRRHLIDDGMIPVVGADVGGFFITTNPDASRCRTSRSAVILPIASSRHGPACGRCSAAQRTEIRRSLQRWQGGGWLGPPRSLAWHDRPLAAHEPVRERTIADMARRLTPEVGEASGDRALAAFAGWVPVRTTCRVGRCSQE